MLAPEMPRHIVQRNKRRKTKATGMQKIASFIAQNRFGLGARRPEQALGGDPRGWVLSQIAPHTAIVLQEFRPSADIIVDIRTTRVTKSDAIKKATRKTLRNDFRAEALARSRHMIATDTPFAERMVLFWSNHFTVSNTKRILGPALPAYEREVIRPHIFGRFGDMLKAAIRHPVMISYLDNQASLGEGSRAGQRRMAKKGNTKTINENLAREILELHTLGVNGGYTQTNVIEVAKSITGWSHGAMRPRRDTRPAHGRFEFNPAFHEPGPKTVMGKTYPHDGPDQGLEILDDLARHPATATFIASKIVRHFVSDTPPADAVASIADVFQDTDGDLAEVSKAIVSLDVVWAEPMPKVKTHYELVIAAHRAIGAPLVKPAHLLNPLRALGQIPFSAPSPAGWGDTAAHWIAPEALMRRIEWLRSLSGTIPTTVIPDVFLDDIIGPVASDATRTWVARAPSGDSALAMILASPEFQRR
jgi:uncharacterized protein (DUF1800 family)